MSQFSPTAIQVVRMTHSAVLQLPGDKLGVHIYYMWSVVGSPNSLLEGPGFSACHVDVPCMRTILPPEPLLG